MVGYDAHVELAALVSVWLIVGSEVLDIGGIHVVQYPFSDISLLLTHFQIIAKNFIDIISPKESTSK